MRGIITNIEEPFLPCDECDFPNRCKGMKEPLCVQIRREKGIMKYYISGPMKGYDNSNYNYFESICQLLRNLGHKIFSPHEVDKQPTYEDYLKVDIKILMDCNAIIMLPGWVYSKGAMLEFNLAVGLKMPVYFYNNTAELKSHILLPMGSPRD